MKKIKVPAKTVQNFETVFDNLHSAIAFNILRREDRTYKNYGLLFLDENGTPTSTDWKVEVLTPYTQTKFRTRVGTSGKALKTIENLTGSVVVLQGNSLAVIVDSEHLDAVVQAIESLVRGAKHGNVFAYLEKQNVKSNYRLSDDLGLTDKAKKLE